MFMYYVTPASLACMSEHLVALLYALKDEVANDIDTIILKIITYALDVNTKYRLDDSH